MPPIKDVFGGNAEAVVDKDGKIRIVSKAAKAAKATKKVVKRQAS